MSMEQHLEYMRKQSMILNPKQQGMGTKHPLFLDEDGVRHLLKQYTTKEYDKEKGCYIGTLLSARAYLREAWSEWRKRKKAQPLLKHKQPYAKYLSNINQRSAYLEIIKLEIVELEKIVAEIDEKQKSEDTKRATPKKQYRGHGKMGKGGLISMDGREVKNMKFVDTGQCIHEYLKEVKAWKKDYFKKKREKQKQEFKKDHEEQGLSV